MDRKGRHWSLSSGTGPAHGPDGPGGASPDDSPVSSGGQISQSTTIVTTLQSGLGTPPSGAQPRPAAQPTRVEIKPEPMDLDEKPSCRFAEKRDGALFNIPGPSGEGATSASVPVSPLWQGPVASPKNTDVIPKIPRYSESRHGDIRRPFSTPPSYTLSDMRHLSPTLRFGSRFQFPSHTISTSPHVSQQSRIVSTGSTAPSTATLSSESNLQVGALQEPSQQGLVRPQQMLDSGALPTDEGVARRQRAIMYQQQLLYVTKRLHRLGIGKDAFGRSQEARGSSLDAAQGDDVFQQPIHPSQRLDRQQEDQSGQSTEHIGDEGKGGQIGQTATSSQGSNAQISGASVLVTSNPSQAQTSGIRGYFMDQPIGIGSSIAQNPSGMPSLSGMFGVQPPLRYGGAVQPDTTIRQLLQRRTTPPYPTSGTPVHQMHHQQQRYVQQQHHQQQELQRRSQTPGRKVPLSQRLSDGSCNVKPAAAAAIGPRRYSAPSYTTDVVMKEGGSRRYPSQGDATAQLTESNTGMESSGSEGRDPRPFVQRGKVNLLMLHVSM
ncbi:uncharacterized protein LOC121421758 [Lytechinus variegatus]|uniref:uncharacterized protein LOC121421758 n=1 Tax=Lytechinus variegatus TaxID=7654 RepID=UPI001BB1ECC0|nr:uncharacterized protein LOC121421758 [Lytechinus variegatus]